MEREGVAGVNRLLHEDSDHAAAHQREAIEGDPPDEVEFAVGDLGAVVCPGDATGERAKHLREARRGLGLWRVL